MMFTPACSFLIPKLCFMFTDVCLKFSSYIQRMTPFFELDATLTPGELRFWSVETLY